MYDRDLDSFINVAINISVLLVVGIFVFNLFR